MSKTAIKQGMVATQGERRASSAQARQARPTLRAATGPIEDRLKGLYASPEFLIRRAHQVVTATFVEACKGLDLTPSQYAALFTLRQFGTVSQNELGRMIALDRSTMSVVLKSLRERRLVEAQADRDDKRKTCLSLTDVGRLLLSEAERLSSKSSHALLSALGQRQAQVLLTLLGQLSGAAERGPADAGS